MEALQTEISLSELLSFSFTQSTFPVLPQEEFFPFKNYKKSLIFAHL